MTAATSQKLADALRAAGFVALAERAERDEFHDFLSPHAMPSLQLDNELIAIVRDPGRPLREQQAATFIRQRHHDGEFDASKEESDDWAEGPEGQDAFKRLYTRRVTPMSQTAIRDERRSALDEFASLPRQDTANLPAIVAKAPPPTLVHGPQPVARFRDESQILIKLKTLAAAAGDNWFYRFPVKDRKTNTTSYIEGPSIKLANDLGRIYGACDVDSWVSSEGPDYWEITARFIDLETGYSLTRPFRQRKNVSRLGGSDDSRRDEIGFSIGVSKAERNVVVNALQTFADFAFDEARNSLVDRIGKDVEGWRGKILKRLGEMAIPIDRVEAVIGRVAKEWLAPEIARIAAMGKAIADGMASIDETFPPLRQAQDDAKKDLDDFARSAEPAATVVGNDASGNPPPAPGGAATGESRPASPGDGSSGSPKPTAAAAYATDAIERILKLVSDKSTTDQEKLESLELLQPAYELLPDDFRTTLFVTAAKVIRKELTAAAAKKYLEQVRGG